MSNGHDFLTYALATGALELTPEGRALRSGRISPYFFNSGLFNTGNNISMLGSAYASVIMQAGLSFDVIFGPAYKGIPLATVVAVALWQNYHIDVGYAFNRKEAKDHGEGGVIVGRPLSGMNVVIVDDVMTTGGSCGEAATLVRMHGGNPVQCVIAFDRQEKEEGGESSAVQRFQREYGISMNAVATLADLIMILEGDRGRMFPRGVETLPKILEYREQYGAGSP